MALSKETLFKCSSAYKTAHEEHPELKAFDASLQERTNKVVNSITTQAQGEIGSLSIHAPYMEVYGHLLDVSQDVAKFVIDSKADVWQDEDLRSLVKAYFENTTKTLDFFNTVENAVNKAEMGKVIIQSAVEQFNKESVGADAKEKNYEKTLEVLKKFKDMQQDFDGGKLKNAFELVKKEQESLLDEVSKLKKKIDEDIKQSEANKKLANYIFGGVFALVVVVGVATFFFGGGALVAGAAVGMTVLLPLTAIGWTGTYVSLQKMEDALIKRQEILKSVDGSLEINKEAMVTIYFSLKELITKISLILESAEFAMVIKEHAAIENAMYLIKEKVVKFTDKIIETGKDVDKFSKLVIERDPNFWKRSKRGSKIYQYAFERY